MASRLEVQRGQRATPGEQWWSAGLHPAYSISPLPTPCQSASVCRTCSLLSGPSRATYGAADGDRTRTSRRVTTRCLYGGECENVPYVISAGKANTTDEGRTKSGTFGSARRSWREILVGARRRVWLTTQVLLGADFVRSQEVPTLLPPSSRSRGSKAHNVCLT